MSLSRRPPHVLDSAFEISEKLEEVFVCLMTLKISVRSSSVEGLHMAMYPRIPHDMKYVKM